MRFLARMNRVLVVPDLMVEIVRRIGPLHSRENSDEEAYLDTVVDVLLEAGEPLEKDLILAIMCRLSALERLLWSDASFDLPGLQRSEIGVPIRPEWASGAATAALIDGKPGTAFNPAQFQSHILQHSAPLGRA